jgi:hypothetical protein
MVITIVGNHPMLAATKGMVSMTQPMICPKCSGHMEAGFIVDRAAGAANLQAKWVDGPAAPPNVWRHGVQLQGRKPVPVTTWRCDRCGYLESFAAAEGE